MFKNIFALIIASVALSVSTVSAGSVRGVFKEKEDTISVRRRQLKEDKNVVPVTPAPVPVSPTPPPAPVPPPTPTGSALWLSRCMNTDFERCTRNSNLEVCVQCIYAQSKLSSTSDYGVRICGKNFCGGCVEQALDFYDCGTAEPKPPTLAPIPATGTSPAPIPATVVVPTAPIPATVVVPTAPIPATVVDPTSPPQSSPEVCSATLPDSGDSCSTGGAPWVYCCYENEGTTASTALVCSCLDGDNRYVCNVGSTGRCSAIIRPDGPVPVPPPVPDPVPVTTAPPVPDPVPVTTVPPVPDPVPVITAPPVPDPIPVTTAPSLPAPTGIPQVTTAPSLPAPTGIPQATTVPSLPAPTGIPQPTSQEPSIASFCQGIPQNGTTCEDVLPDNLQSIGCGGEIVFFDDNGAAERFVEANCSCDRSNPIWNCIEIVETRPPSEAPPPGEEPTTTAEEICESVEIPSSGDECGSLLILSLNYVGCNFMQVETGDGGQITSSASVFCACDARELNSTADATWSCDGTFPPVSTPTLMPAGQGQPISVTMPDPTLPFGPVQCPSQDDPPNDGDSCEGVLPEAGLSSATCNYEQSITANGVQQFASKGCTCRRTTQIWSCSGGFASLP